MWLYLFQHFIDTLGCYDCTSNDSMDDCNSKMTKITCPSVSPNCLTGTVTCSAGDVTKNVYYKRCGAPASGDDTCNSYRKDSPSCPTSSQSWAYSSSENCCSGNYCNSGSRNVGSPLSHMLGICMALIFWAFVLFNWALRCCESTTSSVRSYKETNHNHFCIHFNITYLA